MITLACVMIASLKSLVQHENSILYGKAMIWKYNNIKIQMFTWPDIQKNHFFFKFLMNLIFFFSNRKS